MSYVTAGEFEQVTERLSVSHENGPAMNLVPFVYKQSHVVHKEQRRKERVYTTEKKNCI